MAMTQNQVDHEAQLQESLIWAFLQTDHVFQV